MKKLLYGVIALIALVAIGAAAVYNTAAGQDALLRGAMSALLGPPPAQPEGLRVVICGSASPLGNDAVPQARQQIATRDHPADVRRQDVVGHRSQELLDLLGIERRPLRSPVLD